MSLIVIDSGREEIELEFCAMAFCGAVAPDDLFTAETAIEGSTKVGG